MDAQPKQPLPSQDTKETFVLTIPLVDFPDESHAWSSDEWLQTLKLGVMVRREFRLDLHNPSNTKRLQEALEPLRTLITEEVVEPLQKMVLTPSVKGRVAENRMNELLKAQFPHFSVVDVAKSQSKKGDIIVETPRGSIILIEVKDYAKNVAKPALDKFYRDIDQNPEVHVGILLSLKTGISTKCQNGQRFQIEYRGSPVYKYAIFVANAQDDEWAIKWSVELADELACQLSKRSVQNDFHHRMADEQIDALNKLLEDLEHGHQRYKTAQQTLQAMNQHLKTLEEDVTYFHDQTQQISKQIQSVVEHEESKIQYDMDLAKEERRMEEENYKDIEMDHLKNLRKERLMEEENRQMDEMMKKRTYDMSMQDPDEISD